MKTAMATARGSRSKPTRGWSSFDVMPLHLGQPNELYFMIVFHDDDTGDHSTGASRRVRSGAKRQRCHKQPHIKAEQELSATKEYLQSVIETQEATNEELQSANEEILSSNEELQSTNEELETAKEELQSANEELSTVNDELRNRNSDISTANNDLTNLLSSIDIAVVMLGAGGRFGDLRRRRRRPWV